MVAEKLATHKHGGDMSKTSMDVSLAEAVEMRRRQEGKTGMPVLLVGALVSQFNLPADATKVGARLQARRAAPPAPQTRRLPSRSALAREGQSQPSGFINLSGVQFGVPPGGAIANPPLLGPHLAASDMAESRR